MLNDVEILIKKLCVFLVIVLLMAGCNKNEKTPESIQDLLTLDYDLGPEIHLNEGVIVTVRNKSKECIVFPMDYGIRLFMVADGEVKEIGNRTIYIGKEKEYLYGKKQYEDFISIMFAPENYSKATSHETYAEITGHLCDDETVVITKKIPFTVVP